MPVPAGITSISVQDSDAPTMEWLGGFERAIKAGARRYPSSSCSCRTHGAFAASRLVHTFKTISDASIDCDLLALRRFLIGDPLDGVAGLEDGPASGSESEP